jgi:hypothetical protein
MTIEVWKGSSRAIIEEADLERFEKSGWSKTKKATATKPKRARNVDGTLKADDPSTPQNEAWEGGKAPKKPKRKKKLKPYSGGFLQRLRDI